MQHIRRARGYSSAYHASREREKNGGKIHVSDGIEEEKGQRRQSVSHRWFGYRRFHFRRSDLGGEEKDTTKAGGSGPLITD